MQSLLEIKQLNVSIIDKSILEDIDLLIMPGEIHVLIGSNGSGKSTLAQTIMGINKEASITGTIQYNKKVINDLSPDQRARMGIFLAYQNPVEVPGVKYTLFLRAAYNSIYPKQILPVYKFRKLLRKMVKILKIDEGLLDRNLNEDLSGGEKKKMEILQMLILKPKLVILDEIDSGLDVDSIKTVLNTVSKYQKENSDVSILLISHYQNILEYFYPSKVHIMSDGKIAQSGDSLLIREVNKKGYSSL